MLHVKGGIVPEGEDHESLGTGGQIFDETPKSYAIAIPLGRGKGTALGGTRVGGGKGLEGGRLGGWTGATKVIL